MPKIYSYKHLNEKGLRALAAAVLVDDEDFN